MKQTTQQDRRNKIFILLHYIENNLHINGDFSLKTLALEAGISEFHLYRVFKEVMQEDLAAYIHRMRLEKAARLLLNAEENEAIGKIAADSGFKTESAFCTAFLKHWGVNPTDFTAAKMEEIGKYVKKQGLDGPKRFKHEMRFLNEMNVAFVRISGPYSDKLMDEGWEKLYAYAEKHGIEAAKAEFFGLVHDDTAITPARHCRYDACMSCPANQKAKEELGVKKIGGYRCAVFTHKGSYQGLEEVYRFIYEKWLDENDILPADAPVLEKYLNDPWDVKASELVTEIWFPVQ